MKEKNIDNIILFMYNVFVARNIYEQERKINYEEAAHHHTQAEPNVKLVFSFDSSGTLKTHIQEGAECDLFISAGQKQMDQL